MNYNPQTLPRLDYQLLIPRNRDSFEGAGTGVAWSSSARAVGCSVKSGNERNPFCELFVSYSTAVVNTEEGGDDVRSVWPLRLGRHLCYNGENKELCAMGRPGANLIKSPLSSDCSLQLDYMKSESLVIVDKPCHGEYGPKSCTHRLSIQESW